MEENKEMKRTHRVGTITVGCTLIASGALFLLHLMVPVVTYQFIFRLDL